MKNLIKNRWLNLAGFLGTVTAMLVAIMYFQGYLDLVPCNLCIFQRVGMIGSAVVFLLMAAINPNALWTRLFSILGLLVSGFGLFVPIYHMWVQALPPGSLECGPDLAYLMDHSGLPIMEAIKEVFLGAGSCGDVQWSLLGLSIPGWTMVAFVGVFAAFALQLVIGRFGDNK